MREQIPLTKLQKEIMQEFYSIVPTRVIFNKKERNALWKDATSPDRIKDFSFKDFSSIEKACPALAHQIKRSCESGNNIQPAVFSECVYAQTFSNMLDLSDFINCMENTDFIPESINTLLRKHKLKPRYAYSNSNKSRMFVQAGGCNGIDGALITIADLNTNIYTIEFKESGAKISEPDLPKYGEDGILLVTSKFLNRHPQFEEMLKGKEDLNFFEAMGKNIHVFSKESINMAISNNYTKKHADVICTEDIDSNLVMVPANQVPLWADIEGEIRPAGKNYCKAWTPDALRSFLTQKNAIFNGNEITINKSELDLRKERGGGGRISGYKITPLFFVYARDCTDKGSSISFNIDEVRQLKPTITGKVFFTELRHDKVKQHYQQQLNL